MDAVLSIPYRYNIESPICIYIKLWAKPRNYIFLQLNFVKQRTLLPLDPNTESQLMHNAYTLYDIWKFGSASMLRGRLFCEKDVLEYNHIYLNISYNIIVLYLSRYTICRYTWHILFYLSACNLILWMLLYCQTQYMVYNFIYI